jgi:hypothetical protein
MSLSRIAIIALDINTDDTNYSKYRRLTVDKKIERIEARIRFICEELKKTEKNAMWIVTWREYGITQNIYRSITATDKKLLKQTMQKLVQDFSPNLTILAGTVSTRRNLLDQTKLQNIRKYYANYEWIKTEEGPNQYFSNEESKLNKVKIDNKNSTSILRNTCYIFHNKEILRHDKIAPIHEDAGNPFLFLLEPIFQPGNKKNNSSYFELIHPFTNSPISIGLEICREHRFEILKRSTTKKPFLHFVLSSSIDLVLDKIYGEYVIQLDSENKPRLLLTKNEDINKIPIHLYQSNLIVKDNQLSGPLQPLYPFEKCITDKLDELINLLSGKKKQQVELFRQEIKKTCSDKDMHIKLHNWLEQNQNILLTYQKKLSFFNSKFSIKKWVNEMTDILVNDKSNNKYSLDYCASEDAGPLLLLQTPKAEEATSVLTLNSIRR